MSTDEYEGMPPLEDIVYTSNLNEMLLTKITELEANKQTEQNAGYLIIANCIKYSLDIILRRGYDKYKDKQMSCDELKSTDFYEYTITDLLKVLFPTVAFYPDPQQFVSSSKNRGIARITHIKSTAPGDGDCFFTSIYRCLNNAILLGQLQPCFAVYNPPIVLDASLAPELQYIKALRQMCTKNNEWIKEWENFYDAFLLTNDEYLMCIKMITIIPRLQLNLLGFKLNNNGTDNNGSGIFQVTNTKNRVLGIIHYVFDYANSVIDQNTYKMSQELLNTIKRNIIAKPTFITNLKKITEYNETQKPWATQIEVAFLTEFLKNCGKILIVVKTNYTESHMTTQQPIADIEQNQIIYLLNENESHYIPYLRTPSAESGGGGHMLPEWNCAKCTFLNADSDKNCKMCEIPKRGGSRRKRHKKRKSAKKCKSMKTRARRTTIITKRNFLFSS